MADLATLDVDINGAAALMRRSRSWMQRNWRKLVSECGFPCPFVGGEGHAPPWWRAAAIEAWKDGARFATAPSPAPPDGSTPANDPKPRSSGRDRVGALVAAAGGAR